MSYPNLPSRCPGLENEECGRMSVYGRVDGLCRVHAIRLIQLQQRARMIAAKVKADDERGRQANRDHIARLEAERMSQIAKENEE